MLPQKASVQQTLGSYDDSPSVEKKSGVEVVWLNRYKKSGFVWVGVHAAHPSSGRHWSSEEVKLVQ